MDFLTVIAPDGTRFRHRIEKETSRIGRSSDADVVLQDSHVSRLHAEVVRSAGGYLVQDVRSKNGTFVNERRVKEPLPLRPGDRMRVGDTVLVLNGSHSDPVAISDRPLREGAGTTVVPAREVGSQPDWTPSAALLREGVRGRGTGDIVFEVNRRLFSYRPIGEVLEEVMDIAHEAVRYERGFLVLLEKGEPVVQVRRPEGDDAIQISRAILDRVLGKCESVLTVDALADGRFRSRDSVKDQSIRALMCVPLTARDAVIGLIYVDSRRETGLFEEQDLEALTLLANLTAGKIENGRLIEDGLRRRILEDQIEEARRIQLHLLRRTAPSIPGYGLDGSTFPCHDVGGDYYDFLDLGGGRYGITVADVAGKGLAAATLLFGLQTSFRAHAGFGLPPEELVERLNRQLCDLLPDNRYITFFFGVLDVSRHRISFVNAGHNPPLLLHRGAAVERLALRSLPLGAFREVSFQVDTAEIGPGDLLVCYSDGVTEATDPEQRMFGEEGLLAVLGEISQRTPAEILESVVAAVDHHCAGEAHQDDLTLVVLQRAG